MKKIILTLSLITVSFLTINAQTVEPIKQATWVVESQSENAKMQTVNFYDNSHQLIYSETINTRLNISRRKVQKALNQILENLISQQGYRDNKNLLTASLKLKN